MLTISTSRNTCKSYLHTGNGEDIQSNNNLKMLGFVFEEKPNVNAQIEHLIKKASKRLFILTNNQRNGVDKEKLKVIYTSTIRSVAGIW